ncbi:predicted protein [Uncinocarpus reesii 1704]|uniref:Rhodopsin domain-containing protein n=1 Tax=Uncinocarpus reesii (strain UAMH 1704) TaxID=336963 RepID=C4JT33_UNCRE|nr:uncharacterized protein UREG_05622 [Uncinocarpus reesii 1704]EEP80780.1 predicted protein [Uncinocarpus reesii 1704]
MAQTLITDVDKSALVDIFVWIFLVTAILAVIAQTSTKVVIRRLLTAEDYLILVSLIFAIGQSIAVGIQNQNGWGNDSMDRRICFRGWLPMQFAPALGLCQQRVYKKVVLMLVITSQIQTSTRRRITIASVFAARLLVVTAVAFQLYFLNRVQTTRNATFDYWPMSICNQAVLSLAVVTACIPFLKPFMDSLESGLLRADDQYRRSGKGTYRYNLSGSKSSGRRAGRKETDEFNELGVLSSKRSRAYNGHGSQVESGVADWESNSQSSHSRIIKETRTFAVDVELYTLLSFRLTSSRAVSLCTRFRKKVVKKKVVKKPFGISRRCKGTEGPIEPAISESLHLDFAQPKISGEVDLSRTGSGCSSKDIHMHNTKGYRQGLSRATLFFIPRTPSSEDSHAAFRPWGRNPGPNLAAVSSQTLAGSTPRAPLPWRGLSLQSPPHRQKSKAAQANRAFSREGIAYEHEPGRQAWICLIRKTGAQHLAALNIPTLVPVIVRKTKRSSVIYLATIVQKKTTLEPD